MHKLFGPIAVAILIVAAIVLAVTADGNDRGEAAIRVGQGLGVPALDSSSGRAGEEIDTSPAPDTAVEIGGFGGGFGIAPDVAPIPSFQVSQTGVTVQGFGSATADADTATLGLFFSAEFRDGITPLPEPAPGQTEPGSAGVVEPDVPESETLVAEEITEADVQPIVDAIVAQGVSRADIEVVVEPSYGDPYYGGSAFIRATVDDVDAVDAIVDAAASAASGLDGILFSGSNVSYTVNDCAALELAAMQAAVEDARERGLTFANALGVGLGAVVGASHSSSFPFGSPCEPGSGFYPLSGKGYSETFGTEVQLITTVTVTFAIQ